MTAPHADAARRHLCRRVVPRQRARGRQPRRRRRARSSSGSARPSHSSGATCGSPSAATTNNRMALRSVIESMTALSRKGRRFRVSFTHRLAVHRGRDGRSGSTAGPSAGGPGRPARSRTSSCGARRSSRGAPTRSTGDGCAATPATRRTNTPTTSPSAPRATNRLRAAWWSPGFDAWMSRAAGKGPADGAGTVPGRGDFRASRALPTAHPASP